MKNIILTTLLCFIVLGMQAQTDSIYRQELVRNINEYRKGKNLNPVQLNQYLNRAAEKILSKSSTLKDINGNYNKDSVRKVLRSNGIYDYQFEIVENNNSPKAKAAGNNPLLQKLQKVANDDMQNAIGVSNFNDQEITIITKHYVEWEPEILVSGLTLYTPFMPQTKITTDTITITLKGKVLTENKLTYWLCNTQAEVETPNLTTKKVLDIKNKSFELKMKRNESDKPIIVIIYSEKGDVLSQFNIGSL